MFSRTAINPMDEPVAKATDENLTSENWELILGVCDKVDSDTENGARNAITAIQKRLGHRNANVQLFSLSLAEALSKNCGSKVHREIASRSFSQSLLRLMNDRTIHAKVKARTAELIKQWSNDFKGDSSLGIMTETYNTLKAQGVSLEPPSRPQKEDITDSDRRREEEELQIALAMSLNESKASVVGTGQSSAPASDLQHSRTQVDNGPNAYTLPSASPNGAYTLPTPKAQPVLTDQPLQQTPIAERTAATVSRCRALYDFVANEAGELTFHRGDIITVIESVYKDWWRGSLHGSIGIFPTNYVENLAEPTPADLQREAQEETRIFAEAKNVEKLLSILSSAELNDPSLAENEQLQNLYHSTLSIRPKLVRLIEKYSQKKDDLILLNEKFVQARKDYDELMEASFTKYNSSNTYTNRPVYETRPAAPANYQRPMRSGGYPLDAYQHTADTRPQYATDQRRPFAADQVPHFTGDGRHPQESRQHRTNSIPEHYQQRSAHKDATMFQQATGAVVQLRPEFSGSSDAYKPSQMQSRPQVASGPSHSEPFDRADTQAEHEPQHVVRRMQSPLNSQTGPRENPTSPSRELAEAYPSIPESHRVSSYDHARADREGGPPIAYYNSNDPVVAPQYITPVIPNNSVSTMAKSSAFGTDRESQDDTDDPANYYTRNDHNY